MTLLRKKYVGIVDFIVILSWFYIYFRPLAMEKCAEYINISLYLWDENLYWFGTYMSASLVLILQLGVFVNYLYSRARPYSINFEYLNIVNNFFIISLFTIIVVIYFIYGNSIFPAYREAGALSIAMPGFNFIYPFIKFTVFFTLLITTFLFFTTKRIKY